MSRRGGDSNRSSGNDVPAATYMHVVDHDQRADHHRSRHLQRTEAARNVDVERCGVLENNGGARGKAAARLFGIICASFKLMASPPSCSSIACCIMWQNGEAHIFSNGNRV